MLRLLLLASIAGFGTAAVAAEPLRIAVDRAELLTLTTPAAEIVIGNPAIATALPAGNAALVVTRRAPGSTNLIVLDATGAVLVRRDIEVTAGDVLTIHRGTARESLVCSPVCESVLRPGDASERRDAVAAGMARRLEAAKAAQ